MDRKNYAVQNFKLQKKRAKEQAMTSIIVSYDGTANENDAIAYGSLLAGAGAEVHLGYVRQPGAGG